ncbi:MAG: hypothetical protein ACRDS0_29455 [Pseudonocardiaceae bacterium]
MTGEPPDQLGAYTLRMALVINAAAGLVLAGALVPQLSAPLSLAAAVMWLTAVAMYQPSQADRGADQ